MKILLFGASGSGTTTLGNEIEKRTDFKHLDADDYYWKKANPPFQEKIPLIERNKNLKVDFKKFANVVVTGSLVSWGKEWETAFDLAIFIRMESTKRMERLKKREIERYGEKLLTDKKIQQNSKAFLEWANQYENPDFDGRSLKVHNNWMEILDCKVLQLNGATELNNKVEIILNEIKMCYNNA
ncbi:AAA family ATPase [Flagellimonas meridianipacifica]|uniref:Adenylate kinase family enzyme n=1 Tax=Flagellimonas meridianipacifica TaxID=1080225 RepID=A0A2T0M9N6_9FLAO|nr:AAA family ATPase [Allomuricauda pacifica]PRX54188.1 adenylate kinase family enzyme [Allomuricauda pacifica]